MRGSLCERIDTVTSFLGMLENVPRDDETLYLAGALVDLEDFRVAHQFLYRILAVIAVATKDLRCMKY